MSLEKNEKGQNCKVSNKNKSVIIHIDVDAFECQVYQRYKPYMNGLPLVVANSRGRITSVNYEAKKFGITRDFRVQEALKECETLRVITIEDHPRWGKPDTRRARHASWQILDRAVLPYKNTQSQPMIVNFASVDEFFIDVTEMVSKRMADNHWPEFSKLGRKTILEGKYKCYKDKLKHRFERMYFNNIKMCYKKKHQEEARLMFGAIIAGEICQKIYRETKFKVSAGVGYNMLLAKLGTGLNKPEGITILPLSGLSRVAKEIKIKNIPGLGGERGKILQSSLQIETMLDLQKVPLEDIIACLGSDMEEFAQKVKDLSNGIDENSVQEKLAKDTLSCGKMLHKKFNTYNEFCIRIGFLIEEVMERIQEEKHRSGRLPVSLKFEISLCDREKQFSKTAKTIEWGENPMYEDLYQKAIDGLTQIGFTSDSLKFKDSTSMKVIVTKMK